MGVSQSSVSGRVQNFFIGPELDNRRHPHNTKKTGKLQTLRKKVLRVKRSSRSFDYGKAVKELTNGWATKNIQELLNVFNSLKELKEVTLLAQSARPSSSSLRDDLENLYNRKYCADVQFMYDGEIFSAHRSILSSRCQYFRNLFSKYKRYIFFFVTWKLLQGLCLVSVFVRNNNAYLRGLAYKVKLSD